MKFFWHFNSTAAVVIFADKFQRFGEVLYNISRANEIRLADLAENEVLVNGINWHYYTRNADAGSCIVLIHGITAAADH